MLLTLSLPTISNVSVLSSLHRLILSYCKPQRSALIALITDLKLNPANAAHDLCCILCFAAALTAGLHAPSSANHTEAPRQQLPLPMEENT